jgi:hypothetical protein
MNLLHCPKQLIRNPFLFQLGEKRMRMKSIVQIGKEIRSREEGRSKSLRIHHKMLLKERDRRTILERLVQIDQLCFILVQFDIRVLLDVHFDNEVSGL